MKDIRPSVLIGVTNSAPYDDFAFRRTASTRISLMFDVDLLQCKD